MVTLCENLCHEIATLFYTTSVCVGLEIENSDYNKLNHTLIDRKQNEKQG